MTPRNAAPLLDSPVSTPVQSVPAVDGGTAPAVREENTALAPVRPSSGELELILRMAADPNVPVDKLERLLAMHERMADRDAKGAFEAAMSDAQAEMRPVAADASNPQTRSRYASYKAIDDVLRPIYTKHGFALSFDTGDAAVADFVRVLCYVSHREGHSRTYKADLPADGKGAKGGDVMTKTHATGSAMSYGMRYLIKMIFNVAVGEDDDDGNAASGKAAPERPKGYDVWLDDMETKSDEGTGPLQVAWKASSPTFRDYAVKHDAPKWGRIKARAEKADKAAPRA